MPWEDWALRAEEVTMGLDDEIKVPIECANCGKKTPKSLRWLETHKTLDCSCGTTIQINVKGGNPAAALRKLDASLKKLGAKRR